jgi:hypothetical protein
MERGRAGARVTPGEFRPRSFRPSHVLRRCVVGLFLLVAATAGGAETLKLPTPTTEQRSEAIREARVCEPADDVAFKDLYNGPQTGLNLGVDQEVTCEFVPKQLAGFTEKFLCRLPDGRVFKVKYNDGRRFKEAVSEVLGTRLFWALGFYADKMLPVRVTCLNCPQRPWEYVRLKPLRRALEEDEFIRKLQADASLGTYTFDPAAMEEKLEAEPIEERKDQGWSWKSLNQVDARFGGATKAEIDAFKLLNVFVQNSDNKAKQNALACPRDEIVSDESGGVSCRRPILYVDDLGSVFGKGGFVTGYSGRVDYKAWKKRHFWRSPTSCKTRLPSIGGIFRRDTLRNPVVGEEGRALLADRLNQLSDAQIADLFRAARIESLHETIRDGSSGRREVTVTDWVELFKAKRQEIAEHRCEP